MLKVLVCGSRDYEDYDEMEKTLRDHLNSGTIIINGKAPGADQLSSLIAHNHKVHYAEVPAQWNNFGRAAGPLRNAAMLGLEPDLAFAFYTNYHKSKGTANMVKQLKEAGIRVVEVKNYG